RLGFRQCLRIEFDHRVEARSGVVDGGDAVEVGLGEFTAAEAVVAHARLQLRDVELGVGEVLVRNSRGGGRRGSRRWRRRFAAAAEQAQAEQNRDEHAHGSSPINEDRSRILVSWGWLQPGASATERARRSAPWAQGIRRDRIAPMGRSYVLRGLLQKSSRLKPLPRTPRSCGAASAASSWPDALRE